MKNIFDAFKIDTTRTIGLIFDVDELLYDNSREIFLAYRSLLDLRNIPMHTEECFPGSNLFEIISGIKERYSIEEEPEVLVNERRNKYIELIRDNDSAVKKGVKEIFSFLEENRGNLNVRLAYASSSEKLFIEIILRKVFGSCGLEHYAGDPDRFFYNNGNNEPASTWWEPGLKKKPDPMIYIRTIRKLGLAEGQCIAFEDSPSGLKAALAAGLNVIVVPSGRSRKHFEKLEPNVIYENKYCVIESMLEFLGPLTLFKNGKRIKRTERADA